jgi:hypothetical protein
MLVYDEELYRLFSGLITENFEQNIGLCVEVDENDAVITTDLGCPERCGGQCAANWKPMELARRSANVPCPSVDGTRYKVINPYTRAFGNADFNMRYMSALYAAAFFQGNMNYDWIDTAGIYIKGRADTPELTDALAADYESWEFTDNQGVSNGLTYVAYCPLGYLPNDDDQFPRPGCEMILAMRDRADRLQIRRIEEGLASGRLDERDVGDDWLNPADPERVQRILDTYFPARGFSEFFDLQSTQEMARFHNELIRHFFFVR